MSEYRDHTIASQWAYIELYAAFVERADKLREWVRGVQVAMSGDGDWGSMVAVLTEYDQARAKVEPAHRASQELTEEIKELRERAKETTTMTTEKEPGQVATAVRSDVHERCVAALKRTLADSEARALDVAVHSVIDAAGPSFDDPELDGTDAAHPAWWRGVDAGTVGAAHVILGVSTNGKVGKYSCAKLDEAAAGVEELRKDLAVAEARRTSAEQRIRELGAELTATKCARDEQGERAKLAEAREAQRMSELRKVADERNSWECAASYEASRAERIQARATLLEKALEAADAMRGAFVDCYKRSYTGIPGTVKRYDAARAAIDAAKTAQPPAVQRPRYGAPGDRTDAWEERQDAGKQEKHTDQAEQRPPAPSADDVGVPAVAPRRDSGHLSGAPAGTPSPGPSRESGSTEPAGVSGPLPGGPKDQRFRCMPLEPHDVLSMRVGKLTERVEVLENGLKSLRETCMVLEDANGRLHRKADHLNAALGDQIAAFRARLDRLKQSARGEKP